MQTWIDNARVVLPEGSIENRSILFGERIDSIHPPDAQPPANVRRIDGAGRVLSPGLLDLHIHGVGPFLFERSPEEMHGGLSLLPRFGLTSVLPTLYVSMRKETFALIESLADAISAHQGIHVPGFHCEGPFLALPGGGGMTLKPDVGYLDELLAACKGKVTAMSVSPDSPGVIPVIERLREKNIHVFVTHTRATAEQALAAIDAGARHATHFYDVFPLPPETDGGVRPAGAVEAFLADERCTVDFICDGVHVHPLAIRAALVAKGAGGVVAITDANIGAGNPEGLYDTPFGFPVKVTKYNATRNADPAHPGYGTLCGSSLTMNTAVENLQKWFPGHDARAWQMASTNPHRTIGIADRGVIEVGAYADLVLWDRAFNAQKTWVAGRVVHEEEESVREEREEDVKGAKMKI